RSPRRRPIERSRPSREAFKGPSPKGGCLKLSQQGPLEPANALDLPMRWPIRTSFTTGRGLARLLSTYGTVYMAPPRTHSTKRSVALALLGALATVAKDEEGLARGL